jgi:acetate---CoA ligase (ADP-forming)
MDAYLGHAVAMGSTKAVGLFIETARHPERLASALGDAASRDIPVVALKVGKTARGRAAVATHTAAIAGDTEAFAAFLDAHGVHRVDSPEELVDTLELFSAGRRAAPGGLGAIHDSGGERTLLLDTAEELGVDVPSVTAETAAALADTLEDGLEPDNPVDAWGTGRGAVEVFETAFLALADDPRIGVLGYAVDLTPEEDEDASYVAVVARTAEKTAKPVAVLASLVDAVDPGQAARLRRLGVPVLGSRTGLLAIRHLLDHRDRPPSPSQLPPPPAASASWRRRLAAGERLDESESLDLLADFGVPAIATLRAGAIDEALEAASSLGYPVAMKTAAGSAHKTDTGGVALDIADEDAARHAYLRLAGHGPDVVVQPMGGPGLELSLGVLVDHQFGPVVVVAAGGSLVEMLADRAASLPPLDSDGAAALLDRLRVSRLLDGYRGSPPLDRPAAADAVAALSSVAVELGDVIGGIDVNPLIVTTSGAVAVDALILPRQGAGRDNVNRSEEGEPT